MSNEKMRVKIILNFLLLSIYVYFVLLNAVQGNWQTTLAWGCCVLSWCSERRYICIIEKMINLDEQADEILKESVDFFKKMCRDKCAIKQYDRGSARRKRRTEISKGSKA